MSYEIYKSVKQLADGSFKVISACNNIRPLWWCENHMMYFNEKFPTASNDEKLACWLLYGLYVGDVFYQEKFKKMQSAAGQFMAEKGYDHETFYKNPDLWLQYAREFLTVYNNRRACNYKVALNGRWVVRKLKNRCLTSGNPGIAHIFKGYTLSELQENFKYYDCRKDFIKC